MNLTLTDGPEVALVVTVAQVAAGPGRPAAGGRRTAAGADFVPKVPESITGACGELC